MTGAQTAPPLSPAAAIPGRPHGIDRHWPSRDRASAAAEPPSGAERGGGTGTGTRTGTPAGEGPGHGRGHRRGDRRGGPGAGPTTPLTRVAPQSLPVPQIPPGAPPQTHPLLGRENPGPSDPPRAFPPEQVP